MGRPICAQVTITRGLMRILFITFIFSVFATTSQAEVKAYFEHDGHMFSMDKVVIDGKEISDSWGVYSISEAMSKNTQARELAELHESYARRGNAWLWGGVGAAVVYGISTSSSNQGNFNPSIYWGVFSVGFFTGVYH